MITAFNLIKIIITIIIELNRSSLTTNDNQKYENFFFYCFSEFLQTFRSFNPTKKNQTQTTKLKIIL